jgi:hypothetical protein
MLFRSAGDALASELHTLAPPPPRQQVQAGSVSGTVVRAASGTPLNGVQVGVVGVPRGTITDETGRFHIANLQADSVTLRAKLIGYKPADVRVAVGATDIRIALDVAALQLDEIVVTGTPGATQQRAIGNAVSSVSAEQLTEKAPISDVDEMLQGRVPGLTLMPGAGTAPTPRRV